MQWRPILALLFAVACDPTPAAPPVTHRTVTLLHTADLHSHLFPRAVTVGARDADLGLGAEGRTAVVGGVARLAALLDRERGRSEASLYLDSGDVLEGSSVFSFFRGVPETLSSEAMQIDAQAVGNHDLALGAAALSKLRKGRATFPLLAANIEGLISEGLASASTVLERNGVRVGVIGLGRKPDGAVDLDECAAAVDNALAELDSPVDLVVVLSHLGRDADLSLVPRTSGVDVVLGGHSHDVLAPPRVVQDCGADVQSVRGCEPRPVIVVHSGAYGRYLGRLDLALSSDTAELKSRSPFERSAVVDWRFTLMPVTEAVPERADLVALLGPFRSALTRAGLDEPIAFAERAISREKPARGDSALGNFVTHAMRTAAGADFALINSTGIRSDLPAGELSLDDFFEALPFDDTLVTLELSGDEIVRTIAEVAKESCGRGRVSQADIDGGTLVLGCGASAGTEVRIRGEAVVGSRAYRVATASFVVEGGQWLSSRGTVVEHGGPIRDIVTSAAAAETPCSRGGGSLPCVDGGESAVDGRISWR